MKVQIADIQAQHKLLKKELMESIEKVIDSSQFILGPEVAKLEEEFAKYIGTKYAVALSSGTAALQLSMAALGIKPGDEVITTPFTFIATADTIAALGAKPVFVDIDPKTFNINPAKIEEKITKKTKAIIPVHLYGQPADMDAILKIAKKYKLFVIEDACQAVGAEYKNEKAGTLGDIACFSFFPIKNLGACGDGGIITTNNQELAEKIKMLRVHGSKGKYIHEFLGYKARFDTIQAAIVLAKLKYIDEWNSKRIAIAKKYSQSLASKVVCPCLAPKIKHVYQQYTIIVPNRNKLQDYLKSKEISTGIHYPLPLHLQQAFKYLSYKEGDFPEAEKAAKEVLCLPIYPELTEEQVDYIIKSINEFFEVENV